MAAASTLIRDPDVTVGPFRILPRTSGGLIVYDPRRPVGDRTVGVAPTLNEATELARQMA